MSAYDEQQAAWRVYVDGVHVDTVEMPARYTAAQAVEAVKHASGYAEVSVERRPDQAGPDTFAQADARLLERTIARAATRCRFALEIIDEGEHCDSVMLSGRDLSRVRAALVRTINEADRRLDA